MHVTVIILVFKCLEIRIPLLSPIETDQQRPGKVVNGQIPPPAKEKNAKCAECNTITDWSDSVYTITKDMASEATGSDTFVILRIESAMAALALETGKLSVHAAK